jgi:HEAT repeat protein
MEERTQSPGCGCGTILFLIVALIWSGVKIHSCYDKSIFLGNTKEIGGQKFEQWKADLSSSDENRRLTAVTLFADNANYVSSVVPDLVSLLKDRSPDIRKKAASALLPLGKELNPFQLQLFQALSDPDVAVQTVIAKIVAKSEIDFPSDAVPILVACLSSGNQELRINAAEALLRFGSTSAPAVPMLKKMLFNNDDECQAAASTLGSIGKPASDAIPLLIQKSDDYGCSSATEKAVVSFGALAVEPLLRALKSGSVSRREALDMLGDLGAIARACVPTLIRLRDRAPEDEKMYFTWALDKIQKN